MSIIGVIATVKQTEQIKKEIESKFEIICINQKSIENMKNIKFDVIIINDSIEKLKESKKYLKEILKNAKYLLLNTDISIEEEIFDGINIKIITYGLNQKSTITASSIGESKIIICIQRAFKNLKENLIEQKEIQMNLNKNTINNIYNALIKTGINNIYGIKDAKR